MMCNDGCVTVLLYFCDSEDKPPYDELLGFFEKAKKRKSEKAKKRKSEKAKKRKSEKAYARLYFRIMQCE